VEVQRKTKKSFGRTYQEDSVNKLPKF